jgi:hypothetical protein
MSSDYLPFVIMVWAALFNEILNMFIAVYLHKSNAVNSNIYILIESLLLLWQFKKWKLFESSGFYTFLFVSLIIAWVVNILFLSRITVFISFFRIYYSLVVVLLSIQMVNKLIVTQNGILLKNASFLICLGFILFYTYKLFIEIFYAYGLNKSHEFHRKVFDLIVYVNLFSNLIYALASLWIPKKQKFIQPS